MSRVFFLPLIIAPFLLDVSPGVCEPIIELPQTHPSVMAQQVLLRLGWVRICGVQVNPSNQDARVATRLLLLVETLRVEGYWGLGFAGLQQLRVGAGDSRGWW